MSEPTPSPRRGPAPTKHVDILWTAVRLFARQGVAQTTTREIAAEAGTTERTLFKHFGSKEGLVEAVIAQAVLPHLAPTSLDALRRVIDANGEDFVAWHEALLINRSQVIGASPELTGLLLVELLRDQLLRRRFEDAWRPAVWEPLLGLVRRLQAEGRLRRDIAADTLVRAFLSLNLGYLVTRHILAPDRAWDDQPECAALARLFSEGAARR
ncbi:TetR/AcrR family transcriptional regulator [Aquabacterium humicola]|uniref:TetR/AcrR family transcriptional regulator n=1 Tax=Aquabacterium humicola TaxID=3237377 RepID=UPI0025429EF9|nr:TetR/AcrR family transcriptional regulator [Rubrivivax pictus]